ncbi:low molecular weight protein arginine phosphatase [Bacillus spongiae]|uniref:Low molecular weight protein arginine phosphatase n=1 Tax=Bacillus spongiae TaxID=2683610 RepID=A0ABU8HIQ0_9BACI
MKILFVCTGNTCRSPMAEALLKHYKQEWEVRSAGVYAIDGGGSSYGTKQVLKENDIIHEHSSRLLRQGDIDWADFIFTMTENHKYAIFHQFPESVKKLFTLKEFTKNHPHDYDISDPFGGSVDVYRHTYKELDVLIKELQMKLENQE